MTAHRTSLLLAVASALLLAGGSAAPAQVRVEGRPETVHVEAHDVPLQEVLSALHDRFGLQYRSDDTLETLKTGVFDGPLQRVAARVLEGYDFAMKITPQGIDVLVLRQNRPGQTAVAVVSAMAVRPPMTAAEVKHYASGHIR
ncbi:hypothetical protein [Bradyrhizobium sp. Ash2021]|jgi:hypothetical protein|uniref:hypothetical protein n=1 Tax=Bradyrhizobium sp. Ash2021 TaxID=2954771 RepID=UPI002814E4DB|nr:hypothetical protein [Bradyrhizobium sp. Ash2021]WMT77515.1 hypothetical protein NL528_14675 [Bradyrhizobium sp. Ash2021]